MIYTYGFRTNIPRGKLCAGWGKLSFEGVAYNDI